METNFKLVKNGTEEILADKISWVTWSQDGGGGIEDAHDDVQLGRSLVLDFQTLSLHELLALVNTDYAKVRSKSAYKYLSEPVEEIIQDSETLIQFVTKNNTYDLHIARNPKWNGKLPFTTE
jgi:hypothetical protein